MRLTQSTLIPKSWTAALRQSIGVSMDINEKALLYRSQTGDRTAAGILYARYYREIYSYIFYRVNDTTTAEELSAEVFVQMIKQVPGFTDNGKNFLTWLYALARDLIRDYSREQGNGKTHPTSPRSIQTDGLNETSTEGDLNALDSFRRAIRHLSEKHQEIIIHRFVEGRSVQDISDLINKSERSVHSLQLKALRSLEGALKKENVYEKSEI